MKLFFVYHTRKYFSTCSALYGTQIWWSWKFIPDLHQCNTADWVKVHRGIFSYDKFQTLLITEHFHYAATCWSPSDKKLPATLSKTFETHNIWRSEKQFTQKPLSRCKFSQYRSKHSRYTTCFFTIPIQHFLLGRDLHWLFTPMEAFTLFPNTMLHHNSLIFNEEQNQVSFIYCNFLFPMPKLQSW